jgi:hypothetical protein
VEITTTFIYIKQLSLEKSPQILKHGGFQFAVWAGGTGFKAKNYLWSFISRETMRGWQV